MSPPSGRTAHADARVSIELSPSGSVAVVTLMGEHDLATRDDLRRAFEESSGAQVIVVDVAACTLVDASIVGAVLKHARVTQLLGGQLVVKDASGLVLRAMRLTGMDRVVPVYVNERPARHR